MNLSDIKETFEGDLDNPLVKTIISRLETQKKLQMKLAGLRMKPKTKYKAANIKLENEILKTEKAHNAAIKATLKALTDYVAGEVSETN